MGDIPAMTGRPTWSNTFLQVTVLVLNPISYELFGNINFIFHNAPIIDNIFMKYLQNVDGHISLTATSQLLNKTQKLEALHGAKISPYTFVIT